MGIVGGEKVAVILIIIVGLFLLWVIVNSAEAMRVGVIYFAIAIFVIGVYALNDQLGGKKR